jgi:hypothetical protein
MKLFMQLEGTKEVAVFCAGSNALQPDFDTKQGLTLNKRTMAC